MNIKKTPLSIALICMTHSLYAADVNKDEGIENIIVTAKAPVDAESFAGSVSVITADEIRATGATNLIDVLQYTPGISVANATSGRTGKELRIRGMKGEFGLILINGRRIPNTDRNISNVAYRYNAVQLDNIERIEVIRGPASSLYGADALAGVINIITRGPQEEWNGSLTASQTNIDSDNNAVRERLSFVASGKITDNFDMAAAFEKRTSDVVMQTLPADGLYPNLVTGVQSGGEVKNAQLDFGLEFTANSRLEFGYQTSEEESIDTDPVRSRSTGEVSNVDSITTIDRERYYADWYSDIGNFNSRIGVYQSTTDLLDGSNEWENDDASISIDLDGQLTENHYLNVGLEYRVEKLTRTPSFFFPNDFDEEYRYTTLTLQDIWSLNDSHSITLGTAIDSHNKYDTELSPKLYWNWAISDYWTLKSGYGKSYVAPAIREGSSEYLISFGPTFSYQGNDNLQPEISKTFELGAAYNSSALAANFTVFSSDIDDLITVVDVNDTPGFTNNVYTNLNSASIQGVEADVTWFVSEETRISANTTLLDTENDENGLDLASRPDQVLNLKLFSEIPGINSELFAGVRYTGSQYNSDRDSSSRVELDAYTTVDFGITTRVSDYVEVQATVNNLFDKSAYSDAEKTEALELGRTFTLSLTGRL